MINLEGWSNPVPDYVEDAIIDGSLQIKQGKNHQYLEGEVVHPSGCIISFNGTGIGGTQTIFMLKEIADLKTYG